MILTQQTALFLISTISLMLAYFITTTLSGFFKAWVARLMGDDTPEQFGFLTLNPLAHFDVIGFCILPFFRVGWGRHIPIDPTNIRGSWRKLKTAIAFFSNSFACIGIALIALVALIFMFDHHIIRITSLMVLMEKLSHTIVSQVYVNHSSLMIATGSIFISIIYLSVILSVLQLVINGVSLVLLFNSHRMNYEHLDRIMLFVILMLFILLPLSGIFDIVGQLRLIVVQIIALSGYGIAVLFGQV